MIISYFVVGDTEKLGCIINDYDCHDDIDVNIDVDIECFISSIEQTVRGKKSHDYLDMSQTQQSKITDKFCCTMQRFQNRRFESLGNVNCNQIHDQDHTGTWFISNKCRNQCKAKKSKFVQWKNSILKRDRDCGFCYDKRNSLNKDLRVCKRCKKAYYCSKLCQKREWKQHKKECM